MPGENDYEYGVPGYANQAHFSLPADPNAIPGTVQSILSWAQAHQSVEDVMQLELALQEALANAVVHGCERDPSKMIHCFCSCDHERGVLIVVRDPGPGFDASAVSEPLTAKGLYTDHGRGIFLIRQLMDEVHFERNGTEIHMKKYKSGKDEG